MVNIKNPYRGTQTLDRTLKSVIAPLHFEDLNTVSQKNDSQLIRMGLEQIIEECDQTGPAAAPLENILDMTAAQKKGISQLAQVLLKARAEREIRERDHLALYGGLAAVGEGGQNG